MPLRVTLEVIPRGDESKKYVAGTLDIENDGTGAHDMSGGGIGHYNFTLRGPVQDGDCTMPDEHWEHGRLENFNRKRGWWSCVLEVLKRACTDYDADSSNIQMGRIAAREEI